MDALNQYWKAVIALVVAVVVAIVSGIGNGDIGDLEFSDWIYIALVVLGGTGATWWAENITGVAGGIIKAFLAASTGGLTALTVGYENDHLLSQGEKLTAVAAFLVALTAAYQVPGPVPTEAAVVPTVDVGAGTTVRRRGT